jgi:hypothetical protein
MAPKIEAKCKQPEKKTKNHPKIECGHLHVNAANTKLHGRGGATSYLSKIDISRPNAAQRQTTAKLPLLMGAAPSQQLDSQTNNLNVNAPVHEDLEMRGQL